MNMNLLTGRALGEVTQILRCYAACPRGESVDMGTRNYSDDFKRDAVQQGTVRGRPAREVFRVGTMEVPTSMLTVEPA